MRSITTLVLSIVLVMSLYGQNAKIKRYNVKSGIVKYKLTTEGNIMGVKTGESGTMTVAFKDYGAYESIDETRTRNGDENHSFTVYKNGMIFTVDYDSKTIYKKPDPMSQLMKTGDGDMGVAGEKMLISMGGRKTGKGKVLGYDCDIWEVAGAKQWIYKGVALRIESKIMGITSIQEAISADFNISVSDKYFALPDFEVMEMDMMGIPSDMQMQIDEGDNSADEELSPEELEMARNMTFEEYKEMVKKEDPEGYKEASEQELRMGYEMMKKYVEMQESKPR